MADSAGRVTSIAINSHKVSFALDRGAKRFVLFSEAPNTQTIPQFELATHSWMLSILQTAFTTGKELKVHHDDEQIVSQIEVNDPLHLVNPGLDSATTVGPVGPVIGKPIKPK
jgi:hypothetical protein